MKEVTVMGRTFVVDDNKMLIDKDGNPTSYSLNECFLKIDGRLGLNAFPNALPGDFVTFYGTKVVGINYTKVHPIYLLIRNKMVYDVARPYDYIMVD